MFHSEASGDIRLDSSVGSLGFRADVDRSDASGRLTGSLIGSPREFVHIGKHAWTKSAGGKWTAQPAFVPNRGWDPFAMLGEPGVDVTFVRWETKNADRLAILRVTGMVALDPFDYLDIRLTKVSVDASEFIVEALADGTPRRATWSIKESGLGRTSSDTRFEARSTTRSPTSASPSMSDRHRPDLPCAAVLLAHSRSTWALKP